MPVNKCHKLKGRIEQLELDYTTQYVLPEWNFSPTQSSDTARFPHTWGGISGNGNELLRSWRSRGETLNCIERYSI